MKYLMILFFPFVILLIGCENIVTGDSLKKETLDLIKSLHLLDENETIIKFYSNYKKHKAGNFFTDKRIAHYWLDDHSKSKNDTSFAFYKDIAFIDPVYVVPDTYVPYMIVKRIDSTEFKVYVDGERKDVKDFFEEAIKLWKEKN